MINSKTRHNQGQIVASNPWKSLPKDVMEIIFRHLNLTDFIRSSAVCFSWQSLLLHSDTLRPREAWLLTRPCPNIRTLEFFNLFELGFHTFDMPKEPFDGGRVIGSSRGWLVMINNRDHHSMSLSLFNPIFGANFQLPSLPRSLYRIELSSSDISNCTVVAILDNFEELAICKPGDERWKIINPLSTTETEEKFTLIDLVFCRQKLHVLISSENGNNGRIEDVNLDLPDSDETFSITLICDIIDVKTEFIVSGFRVQPEPRLVCYTKFGHNSYLVESIEGAVLLIQKIYESWFLQKDILNLYDAQDFHNYRNGGDEGENNPNDNDNDNGNDEDNRDDNDDEEGDDNDSDDDEENNRDDNDDEEEENNDDNHNNDSDNDEEDDYRDDNDDEEEENNDNDDDDGGWGVGDTDDMVYKFSSVRKFDVHELVEEFYGGNRVLKSRRLGKEQAGFLSNYSRVCLPATKTNNLRGNCIYFVQDYANPTVGADNPMPYLNRDNGIYNPDDEPEIKPLLPKFKFPWSPEFMWFVPNLQLS